MRRRAVAVVACLVVLLLAGCGLAPQPSVTSTPDLAGVPSALRAVYDQPISWTPCAGGLRCATVKVPLDWSRPEGARIPIALAMHAATGERRGTLFTNPGGPGASGVAWLRSSAEQSFDPSLLEHFDVVAWDTRGSGRSDPVDCYGTADLDRFLFADPDLPDGSPRLAARFTASAKAFGRACARRTGALLAHVSTEDTVRDLDVLRAAAGSPKLDYLGFSYGTYIGALYADAFPRRVGRMVLDGPVDPSKTSFEERLANTVAFGQALRDYLTACLRDTGCPFRGTTVDGAIDRIAALIVDLRKSPIRAEDGRQVNGAVLRTAINAALYTEQYWAVLSRGFADLGSGNAKVVQALADSYVDRRGGGYASNLFEAYFATECLDRPVTTDPAAVAAEGRRIEAADPLRAADDATGLGSTVCGNWPVRPTGSVHRVTAAGAPPILVLGNTGDPATPYDWARSVAGQLPGSVLLTLRGEGHLSYPQRNPCINDRVDRFLVSGTLPRPVTCG